MIQTLQFVGAMLAGLNAKRQSEEGATAVEYGLMVALIAGAIILAVSTLGGNLSTLFDGISGDVTLG